MPPTLTAQQPAKRLPTSIPVTYTDAKGRYCLAYARSPWNAARYLVIRTADGTDLECVHDDFGNLIPQRERRLTDDWFSAASWRPVAGVQ